MARHLILQLEGPLQAWGDVAMDPRRPTRDFPSRSALAGMLANALGWRHLEGERINALQHALRYAVREDRRPRRIRDFQTADLGHIGKRGWTRWGVEERGGANAEGTQLLEKDYLADGSLRVALVLAVDGSAALPSLDDIACALRAPARPLFLGRKGCVPATPIFDQWVEAESPRAALTAAHIPFPEGVAGSLRCWYDADDPHMESDPASTSTHEVWDTRDYVTQRFAGSRRVVEGRIRLPIEVEA
jgi:CRISPR system Cascade subunit CasD